VILGLGYDNTLGSSLGITLIATGFEHKDPFNAAQAVVNSAPKKEEKILMTLTPVDEHPTEKRPVLPSAESAKESPTDSLQPKLVEKTPTPSSPLTLFSMEEPIDDSIIEGPTMENTAAKTTPDTEDRSPRIEWVLAPKSEPQQMKPVQQPIKDEAPGAIKRSPASAASGGYLARPTNIYVEDPWSDKQSNPSAANGSPAAKPEHNPLSKEPTLNTTANDPIKEDDTSPDMTLVFREKDSTADAPGAHSTHSLSVPNSPVEEPAMQDDADDLKRRAAERINKLRNLSFNVNAADPNNEFETVPAYIRRNLELYNTISNVENFYSNYEVKTDENNNTEISTINTFLDGKRPD